MKGRWVLIKLVIHKLLKEHSCLTHYLTHYLYKDKKIKTNFIPPANLLPFILLFYVNSSLILWPQNYDRWQWAGLAQGRDHRRLANGTQSSPQKKIKLCLWSIINVGCIIHYNLTYCIVSLDMGPNCQGELVGHSPSWEGSVALRAV